MMRKVDPFDYNPTEEWLAGSEDRREWMEKYDPGMAYILGVYMGRIDTPKRIPNPEKLRHIALELPDSIYLNSPPGSLERYAYPYGMRLEDLILYQVAKRGPCHGDMIIYDALGPAYAIHDDVVAFYDHYEVHDELVRLCREGKVAVPDGDCIVDVVERPELLDMEPLHMVELFAGIGAFRKAMSNMGIPHTSIMSEINEWATMSYQAIHGVTTNLGDISKVDELPECDILTYGFPCQDVSIAGNMAGFEEGTGTRSSLLWEVRRLLDGMFVKPRVLIMENVANLVSKRFMKGFQRWIDYLDSIGYRSTWKVVNAIQCGVAQKRRRVFMVSVLNGPRFEFPELPSEEKMMDRESGPYMNWSRMAYPIGNDEVNKEYVRMMSPTECFRAMGFTDRDAFRASCMCSDSQLYRQTGNSIVVAVLEMIYRQLFAQGIWKVRS